MAVVDRQDQGFLCSAVAMMKEGHVMAIGSDVPRLDSTKATDQSEVGASAAIAQANFIETLSAASSELEASTGKLTETAASRIGELINIIAGQTSRLALKATIEAMHAGEAESGFAVLAWKALAEQTAKAIAEISQQISGIQDAASLSLDAVKAISGTIERMLQSCSLIACVAEEQSSARRGPFF